MTRSRPTTTAFVKPFSDAMIALQKGQVTETPVKTQFGYHVIKLEDSRPAKVPTFEFNKEQSLASRAVVEAFLKKTGAQLWIEHDLAHFNELKKSPAYYE